MRVHQDWLLTPYRATLHVPTRTAVVADLHLGYDATRRRNGEAVPALGWASARRRFAALLREHAPTRVLVAGDLVESAGCLHEAVALVEWLTGQGLMLGLITGNHDRGLAAISGLVVHPRRVRLGEWWIVHEEVSTSAMPQVVGHCHPVLRCRGLSGTSACYLVGQRRIILPAFSDDAAGLNVLQADLWKGYDCHAIAGRKVVALGLVRNLQSRLTRHARRRVFEPRGSKQR